MALPNIMRRLFRNDGYGPLLKPEIIPFASDLASNAADAAASTGWVKDLAAADLYVDASVASSGDGFTAATAFKTIAEAVAFADSRFNATQRIYLAGGSTQYAGDLLIENKNIEFVLLGNVTINGYIRTLFSNVVFNSSSDSYGLSFVSSSSDSDYRLINSEQNSCIVINCNLSITLSSGAYRAVFIAHVNSSIRVTKNISVSISSSVTNVYAVVFASESSLVYIGGDIDVSSDPATNVRDVLDAQLSSCILVSGATLKANNIRNTYCLAVDSSAILFQSCNFNYLSGTYVIQSHASSSVCLSDCDGQLFALQGGACVAASDLGSVMFEGVSLTFMPAGNYSIYDHIQIYGNSSVRIISGAVNFAGAVTDCSISVAGTSSFYLHPQVTVIGSTSGKKFAVRTCSYFWTGGGGVNRIPGSGYTIDTNGVFE